MSNMTSASRWGVAGVVGLVARLTVVALAVYAFTLWTRLPAEAGEVAVSIAPGDDPVVGGLRIFAQAAPTAAAPAHSEEEEEAPATIRLRSWTYTGGGGGGSSPHH
jgi:hypothetical protein